MIYLILYIILSYPVTFYFIKYHTPKPSEDDAWLPFMIFILSPLGLPLLLMAGMLHVFPKKFSDFVWNRKE